MNQGMPHEEESAEKRFAQLSLKINKFVLSLPLLVVFFLLFPDNPVLKRDVEKSVGMLMIGAGLLSYPLVFAVGRTLAKQFFERSEFRRSVYLSWSPVVCIFLVVFGYVLA